MRSLNKTQLIGHLGKDPEARYTPSGTAVCELSVATSERWKDKQTGEQKEHTEWHTCVCWGRLAEIAVEYLKKGALVYVEGALRTERYTDREGVERYRTKLRVDQLLMLTTPNRQEGAPQEGPSRGPARTEQPLEPAARRDDTPFDDDIPF